MKTASHNQIAAQLRARLWGRAVELEHGSTEHPAPLLRLDADLRAPQTQAPRPFLHPLRTLGGAIASDFAPPDHLWHHGLSFTCAALTQGEGATEKTWNFWGGPTFERGRGYVNIPNHGTQYSSAPTLHIEPASSGGALIRQSVRWSVGTGAEEATLLQEERALQVLVLPGERAWRLSWSSRLKNVCGQPLRWGSPTTEGRENAGYGGLFWRGPRLSKEENAASRVAFCERGQDAAPRWLARDEEMMAHTMRANEDLLFRVRQKAGSFLFACDAMRAVNVTSSTGTNLDWQPKWFARVSVPMVAWAFAFDQERVQQSGQEWLLEHRMALLDLDDGEEFDGARLGRVWQG